MEPLDLSESIPSSVLGGKRYDWFNQHWYNELEPPIPLSQFMCECHIQFHQRDIIKILLGLKIRPQ